jgi:hypothetical protein
MLVRGYIGLATARFVPAMEQPGNLKLVATFHRLRPEATSNRLKNVLYPTSKSAPSAEKPALDPGSSI